MEDQRKNELAAVIIATVVFGILGRLLVRIPYMVFGDFSSGFLYQSYYGGFTILFYFM